MSSKPGQARIAGLMRSLDRIPAGWFLAATVAFAILLWWLGRTLQTDAAPEGILSYEFAGSRSCGTGLLHLASAADTSCVSAILASWSDRLATVRWHLFLDYGFMFAYGGFLYRAGRSTAGALPESGRPLLSIVALAASACGVAAALADGVENVLLLEMVGDPADYGLAVPATWVVRVKFCLLLAAGAALALSWAWILIRALADERPADPKTLQRLRRVLAVKIAGTVILFCVPMLLLGQDRLAALYGLRPEPLLLARLVGGAYAALIVGYAAGWQETGRGRFPAWLVAMGIVSNGGGFVLALVAVATRDVSLDALKPFGFAAIAFAGAIAAGLIWCLDRRRRMASRRGPATPPAT